MKVRHLVSPRPDGFGAGPSPDANTAPSAEHARLKRPAMVTLMIKERLMALPRLGFVAAVTLSAAAGCSAGAPDRASDIQNLNGISDDIAAVRMTQSDALKIPDPNLPTTYPHSYQLPQD